MDWNGIIILSNLFRFARTRLVMVLFTCLKKTLLRLKECRPWRRLPLLGGLWQTFFLHLVLPNQVLLTIINILCYEFFGIFFCTSPIPVNWLRGKSNKSARHLKAQVNMIANDLTRWRWLFWGRASWRSGWRWQWVSCHQRRRRRWSQPY